MKPESVAAKHFDFPVWIDCCANYGSGRATLACKFAEMDGRARGDLSLSGHADAVVIVTDLWIDVLYFSPEIHLSDLIGWALLCGLELTQWRIEKRKAA